MFQALGLKKFFQGHDRQTVNAVDGVSFSVERGRFFTLLGPSGCGKTTTLRCVAGLEQPDEGEIAIDGRLVFSRSRRVQVPAYERDIGMVFQSYAIWPHMTVFENVAFPLRVARRRHSPAEVRRRVTEALERVQLAGLANRDATKLSGGQQQRLALARALVREPKLLLLDEPLSNLDAKLRAEMRFELKRLQRAVEITTLYVTHDQAEALALSNEIAVMQDGRIQQVGPPREIYERPANQFVADFIGSTNFISGEVAESVPEEGAGEGHFLVSTSIGPLRCGVGQALARGARVVVSIRPEHIGLSSERPPVTENVFHGKVVNWVYLGEATEFRIEVGDLELRARVNPDVRASRSSDVWLHLPAHRCVVLHLAGSGRGAVDGETQGRAARVGEAAS